MSDRLEALRALLPDLKAWMESAPADRKAALVAQYRAVLTEIELLAPKEQVGDGIDEITARRAARRPGSAKHPGGAVSSG